jgi:polygalacturonase
MATGTLLLTKSQALAAEATDTPAIIQNAPAEIEKIEAPFDMPQLKRPVFKDKIFNITQYGAKGDGKTKNTEAFKKAIEACTSAGGGQVLVPKGEWFTGPIHLKSNVNLHVEKGAELHFSDDPQDYLPVVFTRWAGFELYNYSPLIYARDCENIAITGPGKLFGHGKAWWGWKGRDDKMARVIYDTQIREDVPPGKRIHGTPESALRPQFFNPVNCKNVLFEGFTVAAPGPFWTFDILYCENVIVRKLRLETTGGPNTDGINLNSTKNALVEYCQINAGDDCVALKSGINEDGWRVGKPTENVVVRHIQGFRSHGGIVIGSDMSGDVRNIFAHDCEFDGADIGIRLKSNASRGGVVENIWYQNIKMMNIKAEAISINTDYGAYLADKGGKAYPVFRDITIKNVTCDGARVALSMDGTSHKPIENITLENVSIKASTGMSFKSVNGLKLTNVKSEPSKGNPISFTNCKDVQRN